MSTTYIRRFFTSSTFGVFGERGVICLDDKHVACVRMANEATRRIFELIFNLIKNDAELFEGQNAKSREKQKEASSRRFVCAIAHRNAFSVIATIPS